MRLAPRLGLVGGTSGLFAHGHVEYVAGLRFGTFANGTDHTILIVLIVLRPPPSDA